MPLGGKREVVGGEGDQVRLSDVDTRRLSGLKYKLICHFKLVADMFGGPPRCIYSLVSLRLQLVKATVLAESSYLIFYLFIGFSPLQT